MSEMVFNNGSVPVAVAAKVYKKDPCWVRAGLIAGWLPIGFATRDGKLITDEDKSVLLDEESVACLDDIWVDRVNAVLNRYEGPNGKSLYVKSMEVYQKVDDDPISAKYRRRNRDEEEEIPFE